MGENWRVRVSFDPPGNARVFRKVPEHYHGPGGVESIRAQVGYECGVTVSLSDPDLFLYAETRDAIRVASGVVRDVLAEFCLPHTVLIEFWHPVRETWRTVGEGALDAAAKGGASGGDGIPDDAELARLEQGHQDAMSRVQAQPGEANWEDRIEFP